MLFCLVLLTIAMIVSLLVRSAAYEALMEIVKNSPKDCYTSVQSTVMVIMERLQQVLQMESQIQSQSDRVQYNDLQSLLCATLQSVLRKVEPAHAPQISDTIMTALLQMFQSSVNNKTGGVQEDALMAVSTLTEVLGEGFMKYMEAFKPFLLIGLRNTAEYQVRIYITSVFKFLYFIHQLILVLGLVLSCRYVRLQWVSPVTFVVTSQRRSLPTATRL